MCPVSTRLVALSAFVSTFVGSQPDGDGRGDRQTTEILSVATDRVEGVLSFSSGKNDEAPSDLIALPGLYGFSSFSTRFLRAASRVLVSSCLLFADMADFVAA